MISGDGVTARHEDEWSLLFQVLYNIIKNKDAWRYIELGPIIDMVFGDERRVRKSPDDVTTNDQSTLSF